MSKGILQRVAALAVCVACLSACGKSPPPATPPRLLTQQEAAQRNTVPFTRPIALDKAGKVMDVQFDLQPSVAPAVPVLKVGIRIAANEARTLLDASDRITNGRLPARVRLERLDGPDSIRMTLVRIPGGPDTMTPLPPDGYVPNVTIGGVGGEMLREAGLHDEALLYKVLVFADAREPPAGRYRLVVELAEDRPQLRGQHAEMIIAYQTMGK